MKAVSFIFLLVFTTGVSAQKVCEEKFTNLACYSLAEEVFIRWSSINDPVDAGYLIERSADGINYVALHWIPVIINPACTLELMHSYVDRAPLLEQSYYRVRIYGRDVCSPVKVVYHGQLCEPLSNISSNF